ncbi:UNVERIFIED_ORG: hypothetical protein [Escherichia phage CMSTMSU]
MIRATEYVLPYAKFTPAGRIGRWDGKVQFMNLGGSTYYHMLDKLLPILDEAKLILNLKIIVSITDSILNQLMKIFLVMLCLVLDTTWKVSQSSSESIR